VSYPLENALFQWEEGHRRIEDLREQPGKARGVDRALEALADELRRRIGPTFTADELAGLYAEGTDWCSQVVLDVGAMAEPQDLADAAFWLYLRSARDFSGGRQLSTEEAGI
jgi:hypothetical protein